MAKVIEEIFEKLSDDELKEAFSDIVEWRKTGVLKSDSIVREVYQRIVDQGMDIPFYGIESPFLFEMARRHYQ